MFSKVLKPNFREKRTNKNVLSVGKRKGEKREMIKSYTPPNFKLIKKGYVNIWCGKFHLSSVVLEWMWGNARLAQSILCTNLSNNKRFHNMNIFLLLKNSSFNSNIEILRTKELLICKWYMFKQCKIFIGI